MALRIDSKMELFLLDMMISRQRYTGAREQRLGREQDARRVRCSTGVRCRGAEGSEVNSRQGHVTVSKH